MLFDTHAHYYAEAFDPDRDAVLSALPAAGVGWSCARGATWTPPRQSIQLAEAYPMSTPPPGPPGGRPGAAGGLAGTRWGGCPPPHR